MDRNVTALVVALLCVLAVSLAAATLTTPEHVSGGVGDGPAADGTDPNAQPGPASGDGDGDADADERGGGRPFQFAGACIPFLLSPPFFGLAFALLVGLFWLLRRRRSGVYAFGLLFPLTLLAVPIWLVLTDCGGSPARRTRRLLPFTGNNSTVGAVEGGGAGGAAVQVLSPPVLLALLVVVSAAVVALAFRVSGDDVVEEAEPAPAKKPAAEPDALAAVGAAAGDAADRIDASADVENEVYRAWREMTDHLDVENPDASTPAEFAEAARDAGMDAGHVDRLTDLFRAVRYGGRDATADREREAVDALRAVEDTYRGER